MYKSMFLHNQSSYIIVYEAYLFMVCLLSQKPILWGIAGLVNNFKKIWTEVVMELI